MKLSELIKYHREQSGLTQDELAEVLTISRQSISKWETGVAIPDIDNLLALADFFDLSLDQLVRGSEHFPKPFIFGRILTRTTLALTLGFLILAMYILTAGSFTDSFEFFLIFGVGLLGILFVLMIAPGPMAVYDEHWVMTRTGISYQAIVNPFLRLLRWARLLATGKDDVAQHYLAYSDILAIEIRLINRTLYGKYFYKYDYKAASLTIMTKDGRVIYLDIPDRFEKYLLHAIAYFRDKKIEILDPHNTLNKILADNYLRHIDFYDYYDYTIDTNRQKMR